MNKRGFLSLLLKGCVAAAILPSALTYERKWKVVDSGLLIPDYNLEMFSKLPFYLVKNEFIHGNIYRQP